MLRRYFLNSAASGAHSGREERKAASCRKLHSCKFISCETMSLRISPIRHSKSLTLAAVTVTRMAA